MFVFFISKIFRIFFLEIWNLQLAMQKKWKDSFWNSTWRILKSNFSCKTGQETKKKSDSPHIPVRKMPKYIQFPDHSNISWIVALIFTFVLAVFIFYFCLFFTGTLQIFNLVQFNDDVVVDKAPSSTNQHTHIEFIWFVCVCRLEIFFAKKYSIQM